MKIIGALFYTLGLGIYFYHRFYIAEIEPSIYEIALLIMIGGVATYVVTMKDK